MKEGFHARILVTNRRDVRFKFNYLRCNTFSLTYIFWTFCERSEPQCGVRYSHEVGFLVEDVSGERRVQIVAL